MSKNNMRPITTLFLIESLDGKISTGDKDELDVDKDFPRIKGVKEGLHQYYEIEKTTDWVSVGTGRIQAKIGVNERPLDQVKKDDVCFVMIDNKPHLKESGTEYFAKRSQVFYVITTFKGHPAFKLQEKYPNVKILFYEKHIDFTDAFRKLKDEYGVEKMTIQTGGAMNAQLLRLGLIDYVSMVIAPVLIGGTETTTSIDGESLHTENDLKNIRALKLIKCDVLKDSYVYIKYEVINETIIV